MLELAKNFENHLKHMSHTPAKLLGINHYYAMKLVDWRQGRYTLFEVLEEGKLERTFKIRARNTFESYSNCKL
jgi:hypothetical protein